jgi:CubicO group peptidase (beta-lactamase class C family)
MNKLVAVLALSLPLSTGLAQDRQPLSKDAVAARVDSMVRAYLAAKGPASISVSISRGDETLVQQAWGLADVASNRPATAASVYKIGSVSKQFTAVLILKQVERGKISLSDSIGGYLREGLRPEWGRLTVEQLLNHTSGLPRDYKRQGRPEEEVSTATSISWAARDTMFFAPGTRHYYSNPGYLLLGALVEKLYGKPYREALQDEIAKPLGLKALGWCADPGKDPAVATGYEYQAPGKVEPSQFAHASKSLGAGGLCSTAADLAAWNRALHGGRVVSPASYAAMITPRAPSTSYGFGLQISKRPAPWGATIIYHLGGIMGFSAENAWIPAESLSITILYNSIGNGFPTNFILELARAMSTQGTPP